MKTLFSGNAQRKLGTVLAGGAVLMLMSSFAVASISTTRHNLGSTNSTGAGSNTFDGTGEICVFCHTPHGADSTASVPIWNRKLGATSSYTRYSNLGTATFDAAEAPIGSVSIACLSCHDGTQAMNVVINTPGSGTIGTMAGNWLGNNVVNGASPGPGGYMLSSNGNLPGTGEFPRLGSDLSNDHPVSMQYGGGGVYSATLAGASTTSATIGATNDPDFAQPGAGANTLNDRVIGGIRRVWYVETPGDTVAGQQKDDLTLYSRTDSTTGSNPGLNQPFVECASCHDPHSNNSTFLRILNTGSALCLTCHLK